MHFASLVAAALLCTAVAGQGCPRPTPPPGGFAIIVDPQVATTYSDGYTAFATLAYPQDPPPTCGWPLVVLVHALGQWRADMLGQQQELAGQGFAVWAYDVRAHGQGPGANVGHANGGTTLWGAVERHDLAEQIAFVATSPSFTGIVDASRVAIVGASQGGAHAWMGAAWSGQPISAPGRAPMVFPAITCVVPIDLVADPVDDWLRGGTMFSNWFVAAISGAYTGVPFDAAFLQQARDAFLQQDPVSLKSLYEVEGRALAAALATSTVPVLYSHGYLDNVSGPAFGVESLESMQGPQRAVSGGLGHGLPGNALQATKRDNLLVRWLNRFLWSIPNEVDVEPTFALSLLPLDATDRDDPGFAWSHRLVPDVAPGNNAPRWYLHDDLVLRDSAPVTPQADVHVTQVVDALATTFTPTDYLNDPSTRDPAIVMAACPLSEQVWSMVSTAPVELARSALLHLHLVPTAPSWMIAASLTVQPLGGAEVTLASRAIASRDSVAGVDEWHDLRFAPVATLVPAGATLRLRLRNLWLRDYPQQPALEAAPMFGDFDVAIRLGGEPDGSWLDLPVDAPRPHLVLDRERVDLATMQPVTATLRGGPGREVWPYFAAVGMSGQVPGVPYLNDVIPIDGDWLALASAANFWTPFYVGFLGWTDVDAEAQIVLDFSSVAPLPQVVNGLHMTLVAFIWDGEWAPTGAASNGCDLMLR